MKTCHTCGRPKPLDEFYPSHGQWKRDCIRCYRDSQNLQRDPAVRLVARRTANTGLDLEEQWALFNFQRGLCALCLRAVTFTDSHLDHDHHTGEARGFLCSVCNRGLGFLGDTVQSLEIAVEYLRAPPAVHVVRRGPKG